MIRPAFDIVSEAYQVEERLNCHLVMEISDRLFSYILFDPEKKTLYCLRQYNFDWIPKATLAEQLEELINSDAYLQGAVKDVAVIYNYAESNLVPESHFDISMNKSLMNLVYGDARKGLVVSEKVEGWNLFNVYRIPREVHTRMQQRFAAGKYWHYYSLLLAVGIKTAMDGNLCRMVFYPDRLIMALFDKGQLQLLQTWLYQTPEDVSYYLLTLCQEFNMDQEKLELQVSGLIDEQSSLYAELLKYFQVIVPEQMPTELVSSELLSQYPSHYFSPLLKMAACV